jgi:hypothetical protein
LQSTFITHGGPDEAFAEKLNQALLDRGVKTFLFKKDAEPGARLSRVMHEGVREHDRVILICSRASLDRPGVLNEIQQTLNREAADGGAEYLLPIRLDDYVFKDWAPMNRQLSAEVRDRVMADFTDPNAFMEGVERLVRALTKQTSGPQRAEARPLPALDVKVPDQSQDRFEGVSFGELVSLLKWDGSGRPFEYWMDRLASTLEFRIEPAQIFLIEQLNALAGHGLVTHPAGTGIARSTLTPMGIWFRRKLLLRRLSGDNTSLWT